MTATQTPDRIWYRARLLPAAQNIFTEAFYPEAKRGSGNQYVWMTQVQSSPTHAKVLVASRLQDNAFRVLTLQLALACLEPKDKATRAEMSELNRLSVHLEEKL